MNASPRPGASPDEARAGDNAPVAAAPSRRERPASRTDGYVLGERLFKDTLLRERKRADRLAVTFAVIVLDQSHHPLAQDSWGPILQAATDQKRATDVVGWLEPGAVLGLILPDVSRRGALDLLERLRSKLVARLGEAQVAAMSMRVYTHGLEATEGGAPLPPVDLLIEVFIPATAARAGSAAAKRALDIVGSAALMVLFGPVMLLVFLAVRLTSPGPVLFRQVRVGRRGEPFSMLKFRSMRTDAGHAIHAEYATWFITSSDQQPRTGDEVYKLTADPRITRVGHWLRKTSLDELPQFWNVLRGEMSLVGPRPPLPFEVERYQPWHRRRVLEAKPGITGTWQVEGRSRTTFDEMVRMDLAYARDRTLWGDIKVLAATPMAMIKGAM